MPSISFETSFKLFTGQRIQRAFSWANSLVCRGVFFIVENKEIQGYSDSHCQQTCHHNNCSTVHNYFVFKVNKRMPNTKNISTIENPDT